MARLDSAVVKQGDFTLGPVTLEIGWGERIGIVGANGAGKSTLLRALLGRAELASGAAWIGPSVVIGEIDQARAQFAGERSLLDAFIDASGMTLAEARTLMAKFGLGAEHVIRTSDSL